MTKRLFWNSIGNDAKSGPGGVGESHLIKFVQSNILKFCKLSQCFEPDDVVVLLTSPTGVASYYIQGQSLAFCIVIAYEQVSEMPTLIN